MGKWAFFLASLLLLTALLTSPTALANGGRKYHVSPSGSDSNPGTESRPWATISRGVAALRPGDMLVVHGGTYREVVRINVSGTPDSPIQIVAAGGEEVILNQSGLGSSGVIFEPGASYILLYGFKIVGSDVWGISLEGGNSHIRLSGVDVSGAEVGVHMTTGYSGQEPEHGPVDNVTIEESLIHHNKFGGIKFLSIKFSRKNT